MFEAIPVIDKDLFEDVGGLSRCCHHQIAPSKGVGLLGIERFYHVSRSASTPSSVFTGAPSHPLSRPEATGISGQLKNEFSYTIKVHDRFFQGCYISPCHRVKTVKTICYVKLDHLRLWNPT